MRPATKRRIRWAIVIGLLLIAIVVLLLTYADAFDVGEHVGKCASSQWWAYLGCAMSVHEGLAGGLVGAAGALFAAWLAYTAIQEQIAEEKKVREQQQRDEDKRRVRQQAEAKTVAVLCITQPIHAAAATLEVVNKALSVHGNDTTQSDQLVALFARHVQSALESFTLRESVRDLDLDDRRLLYIAIVDTLNTLVNISTNQSPVLNRLQRLQNQRRALMTLHTYLQGFDAELAQVFARDSGTTPP
jgi:uncharacterized membrane protein